MDKIFANRGVDIRPCGAGGGVRLAEFGFYRKLGGASGRARFLLFLGDHLWYNGAIAGRMRITLAEMV